MGAMDRYWSHRLQIVGEMKNNNKQLLGMLLLGGLAVYYFSQQQRPTYTGPYQNVPPPPPQNSPNYQAWVTTILQTFGQVADLWKPGGPFYKTNIPPPAPPPGGDLADNPGGGKIAGPMPLLFLLPGF